MNDRPADEDTDTPPIVEFLAQAHTHRRGAQIIFSCVFATALITTAFLPSHFRATASIAIMPSPEFTVREDAGSRALSSNSLAFDQIMKAETEILQSDDLHAATISSLGAGGLTERGLTMLYPDLAANIRPGFVWQHLIRVLRLALSPWTGTKSHSADAPLDAGLRRFADELRVLPAKDSNVISVSFTHTDGEVAANTLNMMLNRYAQRRERIYHDPQLAVAQQETDTMASAVQAADTALTSFKAAHGLSDFDAERDLLLKRRSQAAQSLGDAETLQALSEAKFKILDGQIKSLPPQAPVFQENDYDTRAQSVDLSLVDLRGRLTAASEHYRGSSRLVLGLQMQIKEREAEKQHMTDGAPSVTRVGRIAALDPLLIDRAHAAADIGAAAAQARSLNAMIIGLNTNIRELDAEETRLAGLTRRKVAANESFINISRAAAEQRLTEAEDVRRLANVRIIQPARIPQHPTATKLLLCMAGLLVSGALTFAWLVFKFVTNPTFLTAAGLAHATGLPVLGVFPIESSTIPIEPDYLAPQCR